MRACSYREKFLEVLCEVCDLAAAKDWPGEYQWSADYFSRYSTWYRFRGSGIGRTCTSEGRMLDTESGRVQHLSPSLLTFVMLEFDANEMIAAYTGPLLPSVCIAQDLITTNDASPEVLAISIERSDDTDRLAGRRIVTSVLFVGFARQKDARASLDMLAHTPDMISRNRYHERHVLLSA